MDAQAVLEKALRDTDVIVGRIGPEMLSRSTPCSGWDVRDLLNHLLGQLWVFEGKLAGTEPRHAAPPGGLPATDLVVDDPASAFAEIRLAVLEAARSDGALERAGVAFGAYTTDIVVHGWDLARATGQDAAFEEGVARWCLDFVEQGITDDNRAPAFGPRVETPEGAAVLDDLVAFCGRVP